MEMRELTIGTESGNPYSISADALLTARTAVIGMSGSGKSHLIGVLCEELCKLNLPFVIIDPEGEYFSLKELYEIVWASNQKKADILLGINICKKLAENLVKSGGRLILDTSENDNEMEIVSEFLKHFYYFEDKMRVPILVIVEEADRFVPQVGNEDIKELHEISRRGRKRGIGLLIATQRPAMVDKNVLSQCGNQFIGRLRIPNDLEAVKIFFPRSEMLKELPNLERGQFYVMGNIAPAPLLVQIRARETKSPRGATPEIAGTRKFTVDNFLSEVGSVSREIVEEAQSEESAEDAESSAVERVPEAPVQAEEKLEKTMFEEVIPGLGYAKSIDDALNIVSEKMERSFFTRELQESIGACNPVYWPLMVCRMEVSKRSILSGVIGKPAVKSVYTLWDTVFLAALQMNENYELEEIASFDGRLCETDWKEIRILRETTRGDRSVHDLVPATGLTLSETRSAVRALQKKGLLVRAGVAGRNPLYRSTVAVPHLKEGELASRIPEISMISLSGNYRKLNPRVDEKFFRNLVVGLLDDTEISESNLFYFPVYIATTYHKKKGTQRVFWLNGITGTVKELKDWRAQVAVQ